MHYSQPSPRELAQVRSGYAPPCDDLVLEHSPRSHACPMTFGIVESHVLGEREDGTLVSRELKSKWAFSTVLPIGEECIARKTLARMGRLDRTQQARPTPESLSRETCLMMHILYRGANTVEILPQGRQLVLKLLNPNFSGNLIPLGLSEGIFQQDDSISRHGDGA